MSAGSGYPSHRGRVYFTEERGGLVSRGFEFVKFCARVNFLQECAGSSAVLRAAE